MFHLTIHTNIIYNAFHMNCILSPSLYLRILLGTTVHSRPATSVISHDLGCHIGTNLTTRKFILLYCSKTEPRQGKLCVSSYCAALRRNRDVTKRRLYRSRSTSCVAVTSLRSGVTCGMLGHDWVRSQGRATLL